MGIEVLEEKARRDAFFKEAVIRGFRAEALSQGLEKAAEDPRRTADILCEEAKRLYEEAGGDVRFYRLLMRAFLAFTVVLAMATMALMLWGMTTGAVGSAIASTASAIISGVLSEPLKRAEERRDYYLGKIGEWCTKAKILTALAERAEAVEVPAVPPPYEILAL